MPDFDVLKLTVAGVIRKAKVRKEELEKEINEARSTMSTDVKWPDQESEAFKDEVEKHQGGY